uniref:NADH-ubiquinone oxidoreductase chain 5 n=1 Tax=Laccoptera ruginosa TaxID=1205597 RepID=A0A0S2MNX0_9CUCU|nr:NADH deshydrogenase subunit 5 [Laccoptera ruginosa]
MLCFKYSFLMIYLFFFYFSWYKFFLVTDYSIVLEISMMNINSSSVSVILLIDWVSLIFSSFVILICSSVLIYSYEYMLMEKNINRFVNLVLLFLFSMVFLIYSPNLISILLGWDGLGLVSYCLVIYYQNVKSYNAGMLTILTNRIGDVFLMMSIVWMINYGSWNCFFYFDFVGDDYIMALIMLLVILAGITKSAQIPFSSWLPAAMAAPTPVSSLVHSSTLVTAGIYLFIRFSDGFNYSMMMIMLYISVLTMFMAGLVACFEFDLKKIIAMSTLSQLGLMMSVLFMGDLNLAFFHLLTHALFKALLFMCAGYMIHSFSNCQDIRFMGSLVKFMPITMTYFFICNFSLCGLPFLSGFYSKDFIIEFMMMNNMNFFILILYFISLGLTILYSFRLMLYLVKGNFSFISLNSMIESWGPMLMGMSILICFVIFSGSMLMWLMFNPYYICLPLFMKISTLLVILISLFLSFSLYEFEYYYYSKYSLVKNLSYFIGSIFYLTIISTLLFSLSSLFMSKSFYQKLDNGWFEYYGSSGLFKNLLILIKFFQFFSINHFKFYLLILIFWLLLVFYIL